MKSNGVRYNRIAIFEWAVAKMREAAVRDKPLSNDPYDHHEHNNLYDPNMSPEAPKVSAGAEWLPLAPTR